MPRPRTTAGSPSASSLDAASLWLDRPRTTVAAGPPPPGTDWDVVVVGGGLAGVMTALRLAERGARVALFEARRIAGRTTGHSTAKVTALHGAIYSSLVDGKGVEAATRYADANMRAVATVRGLIDELGIDCDAVEAPALTCAEHDVRLVEEELEAARFAGLPVDWSVPDDLPFPVAGAVVLAEQLMIDPVAFCDGLVSRFLELGGTLHESTRVTDVDESDTGTVVSGPGFTARCDAAVVATHLPVVDPGLLAGRATPMRSYVVAGRCRSAMPTGMYLAVDAGWSIRPAGSDGETLLVGGEGHPMLDEVDSGPHFERLQQWAEERCGVEVAHRWSAFDYVSVDGVPYIGRLAPGSSRRFVATGFGKWGMSTSIVAADVIADLIDGGHSDDVELFDATRLLPTLGRDVVKNSVKAAKRFVGDRADAVLRRTSDVDQLEPGAGVIVRRGGRLVGTARADDGRVHQVDATCTHLGCIVAFNAGEQTWDCPCHGSRYSIDGAVLDGPASEPLASVPDADDHG